MLAKFDPIISNHINTIQKNCTPDVTHVEQIPFVARIVDMSTSPIEIKELFLGFYPVLDATGEGLFNFFTNELLSTYDLDVQNIRGQGYDNGFNIKEKKSGLQCRLKNVNPRAMMIFFQILILTVSYYNRPQQLNKVMDFLNSSRCDAAFNKYINDATTLATDLDIEIEFHDSMNECHDERIQVPKLLFKVEFYFTLLDTALNFIQERFTSLNECNALFKFLIEFRNMSEDDLRKSCADFDIALQVRNNDDISRDVDGEDLYNELIISSMCQERLSNLSLVPIEKELSEEINLDTVIDELANKKARKVQF
ncbi:uncharacterized protein [Onthophagus taurus]|uniref:uncharacterized protein n=1 Tax=Onthophagus taurus TaxID=166361 RepID=UPI0039BE5F41